MFSIGYKQGTTPGIAQTPVAKYSRAKSRKKASCRACM